MSNKKKAFTGNAADEKQVKEAARKERDKREDEINDMKAVLATPEGRRVMYRILEHCGILKSIWTPSAEIHFRAGRQDAGLFLMSEIVQADDKALTGYLLMMKEANGGEA